MASGTCLLSTAVGGVPEVMVNGQTGVLIEPDNAEILTEAVCNTLCDAESIDEMQINAREKIIRGYTWNRLIGELNCLFGSLK
jgi:spore coat protein SA